MPVSFCPPKPSLVDPTTNDLTVAGKVWLGECLSAAKNNCVAIQAYNGEDIKKCDIR